MSLAVVALGFLAGSLLQAQVRVAGATNFNESCCAIGMRGPSVPANSHRLVVAVTDNGRREFRGEFHHRDGFNRHDHSRNQLGGFGGYPIYYNPYGYDDTQTMNQPQPGANNNEQPVEDSGPGLTVFERRREYRLIGDSAQYQRDQQSDARDENSANKGDAVTAPSVPPEEVISTILIYRDGSHREIGNYALMGGSIFDLSVKPGQGKMRILLADLDIPATIAANDQRGIEFKVPSTQ